MSLLELAALNAHYGDFQALYGVSLAVEEGQTFAVIGANGAGKSTLLKTIAGLLSPTAGTIRFGDLPVEHLPAYKRVDAGISLVPEGRRVFPSLTVQENLQIGSYARRKGPWNLDRVYDLFPLLKRLTTRQASSLSGGEQQALAIGRALMANPRLLVLDEVSLGLAPIVVQELYAAIRTLPASGTTILIVEQDIKQVMSVADYVVCLLEGRVSLEGTPASLSREQITTAYFGVC
ncbi:MAG: ABC transporter ATP-binding protein [Actinobacteria bacterium]|nr:ABC transporter ATP-binding protein [Actinomycetota bacterium]